VKIVLASHHYPPAYVAGVELLTERLARWLATRGHTVEVVVIETIDSDRPLSIQTDVQDGVVVHRLALQLTAGVDPLGVRHRDENVERWFADYLRHAKPDVFHSQSSYLVTASLLDAAHRVGVPTVASLHDYWYLCPRIILLRPNGERCDSKVTPNDCARCVATERRRYRVVEAARERIGAQSLVSDVLGALTHDRRLEQTMLDRHTHLESTLRSVDQIVTPALFTRELLLDRGFSPQHVRLMRQGLRRLPPLAAREWQPDQIRIGYMGQLAAHKGVHVLVEAFDSLSANTRSVELRIYGDATRFPSYTAKLRRTVGNHPGVRFMGSYNNERVAEVFSQFDVLVVPSLWYEISPLVILEAFSARVPVIASDLRNMNYQIRNEVDGLLFEAGNPRALKEKLQRLVDEPGLLSQLIDGIQPVHEIEHELRELEAIYRVVASKRSPQLADALLAAEG
jgi:glycosyltransferase involved in cell wall biosynthesis